ncbi:MAG: T9SS type A sorting domain-containing protein [Flavobacteriales bacterium]|nr:T9SS type A sorting domain-containing protein [Flavobacteriales bacterium]
MKEITLLILLIVSPYLHSQVGANEPDPLAVCDINNDGIAFFDLTMADSQIIGGQTDVVVTYHETLSNAQSGIFPINSPYQNFTNPQVIYPRVESILNADFDTTELLLLALSLPDTNSPEPIVLIDQNGDGFEIFDLTIREVDIADPSLNYDFYYFETEADVEDITNSISNPTVYVNLTTPSQTIYIRVEDPSIGCFTIENMLIAVDNIPIVPEVIEETFAVFDDDGDGFAIFDLTTMVPEITGGQTGLEVTFYKTETDAENKTNFIEEPEVYENITNPQTIYARTETIYGSFALTTFTIFADKNLSASSFELEEIDFYPNPAQDFMHFKIKDISEDFKVEIIDLKGQRVYSKNYASEISETVSLNVSNLNSGIYFLKITSGKNQIIKKVIKK